MTGESGVTAGPVVSRHRCFCGAVFESVEALYDHISDELDEREAREARRAS